MPKGPTPDSGAARSVFSRMDLPALPDVRGSAPGQAHAVNLAQPSDEPPLPDGSRNVVVLSRAECLELLASQHFGRVATVMNGLPVIRPVNYVFDHPSQSVVLRTAAGSKLRALLSASRAAFETDGIDDTTMTGWSVVIDGVTAEVTDPTVLSRLKRLGLQPWVPGANPHWISIRAWRVSGRRIILSGNP